MARARIVASAVDFALMACHTRVGDSHETKDNKDIDLIRDGKDNNVVNDSGNVFGNDEGRPAGLRLLAIRTAPTSCTVA